MTTILGDCLTAVPAYAQAHPFRHIDLVHIDGEKTTYHSDFDNILPVLKDNAIIVFDDSQQERVRAVVDDLLKERSCSRIADFPCIRDKSTFTHDIVQLSPKRFISKRTLLAAVEYIRKSTERLLARKSSVR